jgi:Domain of unknown function (DUF932)
MRSITTLDALLQEVVAQNERKHDVLADTRKMSVIDTDTLVIDADHGLEAFKLNDHALGQMSTDLGIPKRYFDRMRETAPDLFQTNVHHWFASEPNRRMIRGLKPLDRTADVSGRAWLSDRYRRLDNIEIAVNLLPEFETLATPVTFHNASISDSKFYLRAVFPRMEAEVKVGDVVQWGVQIRNSEVGAGTFAIENFVLRLVCTNGMVVAKVMNARHVGRRVEDEGILSDEALKADDKAFWLAARDTLRASLSETVFESVIASLRETTEGAEIVRPLKATERLGKTLDLTEAEQEEVLAKLTLGGDMSRWGALNAITAAAKTADSFDRQVEMEEMGWSLASLSEREWERIAV